MDIEHYWRSWVTVEGFEDLWPDFHSCLLTFHAMWLTSLLLLPLSLPSQNGKHSIELWQKKPFSIICLLEGILWLQWTKKWAHFLREELCSNTGWYPRNICLHLVLERVGVRGIPQRTQTVLTLSLLLSYYGIALNTSSIIATKWELVIFNHSESFCEMDIYFYYISYLFSC